MKKIYLVKFDSFHAPYFYWCLCTDIVQYCFEENHELYTYKNYISLRDKKVNWVEANLIYSLTRHESGLCAGKAMEIIELTESEDALQKLFAEREAIESKISAIDPTALMNYELERLNIPTTES